MHFTDNQPIFVTGTYLIEFAKKTPSPLSRRSPDHGPSNRLIGTSRDTAINISNNNNNNNNNKNTHTNRPSILAPGKRKKDGTSEKLPNIRTPQLAHNGDEADLGLRASSLAPPWNPRDMSASQQSRRIHGQDQP